MIGKLHAKCSNHWKRYTSPGRLKSPCHTFFIFRLPRRFGRNTLFAMFGIHQEEMAFQTRGHRDIRDLTAEVAALVTRSKIRRGLVHLFNVGSTACVGIIEFEPGLAADLPAVLDKLIPPSRAYGHEEAWHDGNGHSHLQATLMGPGLTVPIRNGELVLGEWQQIFHLECDVRSRQRTVVITIMGE